MSTEKIMALVEAIEANYRSRVTVWGDTRSKEVFVECKGFTGPSKKVEKIIAEQGLRITDQRWSEGSNYLGYYYWVEE